MRVLVVGLAVTGEAVVRHRRLAGDDVTVVEDRPEGASDWDERASRARDLGADVVAAPTTEHVAALAAAADLVVPSPGVPERHAAIAAARRHGVPVRSEIDLAGDVTDGPAIVAVTGTNGKTTVTTLTAAILEAAGVRSVAAGNIGRPLIDAVHDDVDVVVAEVSSFQLAFADRFAPRAAALLNLGADHLDWHRTFDGYAHAKAKVFLRQGPDDLLVFNADDPVVVGLAASAPGRRVPFSLADGAAGGARLVDTATGRLLVMANGEEIVAADDLPCHRPVDLANALAASALALDVGADAAAARDALEAFGGLAHRMELVAVHDGVRWVDDSKATNVHATVSAVRGLEHVVLIAGGRNKGIDLSELRILTPSLRGVVAIGDAAAEVDEAFAGSVPVVRAASMHTAVRAASELATDGDTVLLSPGCASFDWYASYAARGDDFATEVRQLAEVER
ncbi:MAG: UDP-N-acetylmuramoyl-L-alanine--D-glutamate ligase [Acidimicrobiia bacterium]